MKEILVCSVVFGAVILILTWVMYIAKPVENADITSKSVSICIDGVAYWQQGVGQSRTIAPRIDPQTLSFVLCK